MTKKEMPDLSQRRTRALAEKSVVRTTVRSATFVGADETGITLALNTRQWQPGRNVSEFAFSSGSETSKPKAHDQNASTLARIEILGPNAIRFRSLFSSDTSPVEHRLWATPVPTGKFKIEHGETTVTLHTQNAKFEINLSPFSITAFNANDEIVAEIGGREKNFYASWDAYNTGLAHDASGAPIATETFAIGPQEAIYGFGEQFGPLNKIGQTIDLITVEAAGTIQPRSYKPIPFWLSTRGYGIFLNHTAPITAFVGTMSSADLQVAIEDDHLDYVLFVGAPSQVLSDYTALTGRPDMPPEWSFGLWQSKISYKSADEALQVVSDMKTADIPISVLHLDTHWFAEDWRCDLTFDQQRFPDPERFFDAMAAQGVKVSLWQLPYIPEGSALFDDLAAIDGFIKTQSNEIYDVGICYTPGFSGVVGAIDFTNPQAIEVYQGYLERLLAMGAAAIKVDFGEQAPLDGVYHDGTTGERAHNLYPFLYNQAVAEVTKKTTGESIIWARSTWAGSQRFPLHWGGDSSANWSNMAPQFRAGLSMGLSGFSFWSQDIGGFLGDERGALFLRWLQAGCFLSHARIHGTGIREIPAMGDDTFINSARDTIKLRQQFMPYILTEAAHAAAQGQPMMRPLLLDYPDDLTTHNIDDQWFLGRDLLVAPIMSASNQRKVYLPPGVWIDWWTKEEIDGTSWLDIEMPLDRFPLYWRKGADFLNA